MGPFEDAWHQDIRLTISKARDLARSANNNLPYTTSKDVGIYLETAFRYLIER